MLTKFETDGHGIILIIFVLESIKNTIVLKI